MLVKELVHLWFSIWENGNYSDLPISKNFQHTSPFGTIVGREAYLALVKANEEKFLGYQFEIVDMLCNENRACIRYTARQGSNFKLDVSEWHYVSNNAIDRIVAYYHIGEIREERQLVD